MKARVRRRFASKETHVGFQIAPMIDVVFVILLFFMVAAGQAKVESGLSTKLPGCCGGDWGSISMPDEIFIVIDGDGNVSLNDEPVGSAATPRLTDLQNDLLQLKQATDGAGAKLVVTIFADEQATYQRVVDVLDALGKAGISNVAFQAGSEE